MHPNTHLYTDLLLGPATVTYKDYVVPNPVDMSGFSGVRFLISFGPITNGTQLSITAYGGNSPDSSDLSPIPQVSPVVSTHSSEMLFILDVPQKGRQYVTCMIEMVEGKRGFGKINCIIAELYGSNVNPVQQSEYVQIFAVE